MRGNRFFVACLLAASAGLGRGGAAEAQVTTLVGIVRDSGGRPVADVELRLNGGPVAARTTESGGFRIPAAPVGVVRVGIRRLGFSPSLLDVTLREGRIDSLVVTLSSLATSLPGVVVEDERETYARRMLAGFWERRSRGFGAFMTREQVEARNTSHFVDLVRRLPNTSIVNVNGRQTIRLRQQSGRPDCPPQYFVDGMRLEQASPDEFTPSDIEGIEVYAGPATIPPQFSARPNAYTCGAIIIWTRIPGT